MSPRTKKVLRFGALGAVVVGVGIQFVPVKEIGNNPPHRFKMDAPPEVEAILRRACFDCHSNETHWPIYSRVAPGSWLMARDIHNGRNHLNFSEWADVDEDERQDDLENGWEQVESGAMPKWFYIFPFHPNAKLSDADKAQLKAFFLKNAKPKDGGKKAGAKAEEKKAD
jgi:heme-binding protein